MIKILIFSVLLFIMKPFVYAEKTSDNRLTIEAVYKLLEKFSKSGLWNEELVFTDQNLPVKVFYSKIKGPAIWIIAGIHGEEPAPVQAVLENIELLNEMAKKFPIVLFPLSNPVGYKKNWRYPDAKYYDEKAPGHSVGDSEHYLLNEEGKPRMKEPSSFQAKAFSEKALKLSKDYYPLVSIDLHEDNSIDKAYIYSQGKYGREDLAAKAVIKKMVELKFEVAASGKTNFNEIISDGIVSGVKDGSIDELLSAEKIGIDGKIKKGPSGNSILVIETSSISKNLKTRVKLHSEIIKMSGALYLEISKVQK